MDLACPPSPSGDFVVVESNNFEGLATRKHRRQDEIQQYPNDQCSDSDIEHISRPGSVRSLSTRSPSPLTEEHPDQDDDISITCSVREDLNPNLNAISQHGTPSQPTRGVVGCDQRALPAAQAPLMVPSAGCQAGSHFMYHQSSDNASQGEGVLTPPPGAIARHTCADMTPGGQLASYKDADALRHLANEEGCDHSIVDQYIMDLLIESALNTRLECEFVDSASRDQNLRQQMMTRLRSLPVDHPVVRETTKHRSWGSFLFKHQARDAAERKHVYQDVFTSVELTALQLLLVCHQKHFDATCSFADVSPATNLSLFCQTDLGTLTKASKLALQTQMCCFMSTSLWEGPLSLKQNQLRSHTRTAIERQMESFKNVVGFQIPSSRHQGAPRVNLSSGRSVKYEEGGTLWCEQYERIATRDIFNKTLTNLPSFLTRTDIEQQDNKRMSRFLSPNANQPPHLQVQPAVKAEHGSWNVSGDQLQHYQIQQRLPEQHVKECRTPEAQESEVEQPELKPLFSGGDRSQDYQKTQSTRATAQEAPDSLQSGHPSSCSPRDRRSLEGRRRNQNFMHDTGPRLY